MMMEFHGESAIVSDRGFVPHGRVSPGKASQMLIRDRHLREILMMFRDLGLTPREMSRTSGLPPMVIAEGLKRLDQTDRMT